MNLLPALGLWLIPLILVPWVTKREEPKTPKPNFGAAMFMSLGAIGMTIQLLLMWDTHIMHMFEAGSCPGSSTGSGRQQGQGCSHWWEEAEGLVSTC